MTSCDIKTMQLLSQAIKFERLIRATLPGGLFWWNISQNNHILWLLVNCPWSELASHWHFCWRIPPKMSRDAAFDHLPVLLRRCQSPPFWFPDWTDDEQQFSLTLECKTCNIIYNELIENMSTKVYVMWCNLCPPDCSFQVRKSLPFIFWTK